MTGSNWTKDKNLLAVLISRHNRKSYVMKGVVRVAVVVEVVIMAVVMVVVVVMVWFVLLLVAVQCARSHFCVFGCGRS